MACATSIWALQAVQVLRRFLGRDQHHDLAGAVRDGAEPDVQTQAGGVPQGQRDHVRRHALRHLELRRAAEFLDQRLSPLLAVQQDHGVLAACCGIGAQQRLEPHALLVGARVGIGECPGRADRGAGATAHAQVGVDLDLLAALFAGDRFGRADVHAGAAAGFFVAAVGAELLLVDEELRLLELADQLAQLEHRVQVLAVPAEIALRQRVLVEGGRGAGGAQVQHQVEALGLLARVSA
jgi:hypothetical protein